MIGRSAVGESDVLRLDHQPAGPLGLLDLHAHLARLVAAGAADFAQLLQRPHAAFVPRAPGLDSRANPDLFLGQLLVELGPLPGLGLQGRLFALQIRLVVARPTREPAAVEFDDARGQPAQERPIVRDEQDRAVDSAAETLRASAMASMSR